MKLFEVLNSPVKWEWTRKDDDAQAATFEIGDRTVYVSFHVVYNHFEDDMEMENPPEDVTEVEFSSRQTSEPVSSTTTKITHTGNEFEVFATVASIIQAFIRQHNPPALMFGADVNEPSRVKLYKRFVKKLGSAGYETKYEADDGSSVNWVLVKK